MALILQSPGVGINEIDYSQYPVLPTGTKIFITGFSSKGPTDQILQIDDIGTFENIYGIPTTPAERYFYYSAEQILNAGAGTLYVNRLPYGPDLGDGFGSKYSALVYPVIAFDNDTETLTNNLAISSGTYVLGEPKFFELTSDEYYAILNNSAFQWSDTSAATNAITSIADFGKAGLIILNTGLTTIDQRFEGYYIGITDNVNLLPTSDYDSILAVKSLNSVAPSTGLSNYINVPESRLDFALSGTTDGGSNPSNGSISEVLENIPTFDTSTNLYNDTISIGVFRLLQTPFTVDTISLDAVLVEAYNGSADYWRKINNPNGGPALNFFIENQDARSQNIAVLVNDFISNRAGATWIGTDGVPTKSIRVATRSTIKQLTDNPALSANVGLTLSQFTSAATAVGYTDALYPLGAYSDSTFATKELGSIPRKLDRVLQKLNNDEEYDIDIIVEAGLGTIYAAASANATKFYDDTQVSSGLQLGLQALQTTSNYIPPTTSQYDLRAQYTTIASAFINLCEKVRKDCVFIADPLRHIMVLGAGTRTLSNPNNSFSQHIYSPLRHQFSLINSSYAICNANWALVNDKFSGQNIWIPFSGVAAANMAVSDANYGPWYAPAGFRRGLVGRVADIAINPKQKERDQLYKISLNPVSIFSGEGIVIFGQKTLLNEPSAFNRINIRRLFLYLEKAVKATAKYFVFEPNNLFTRTRVINTLTPIFESVKQQQGMYNYLIVCDSRNNPPSVIDQNQLVIDFYVQGTRVAEFIYCNFISTQTGVDFNELINLRSGAGSLV